MNKDRTPPDAQWPTSLMADVPAISPRAARGYEAPRVLSVEPLEVFAASCDKTPSPGTVYGKFTGPTACSIFGS
jgi:hypothetical protein